MKLLVFDVDYNFNRINDVVIRIFGKDIETEENVTLHILNFEPYIYISNSGLDIFDLQKLVESKCKGYIKRCEIVKKFLPVGYQIEKSNFLKLVLFTPKIVRELRQLLKEQIPEITDASFMEADVQFKNRYMIDYDVDGMSVIEFNEKDKKIENYGLNCSNIYVIDKNEVKVLNENVIIEY